MIELYLCLTVEEGVYVIDHTSRSYIFQQSKRSQQRFCVDFVEDLDLVNKNVSLIIDNRVAHN